MVELSSPYPILNQLVAQSVNLDELDYLAKRLERFCEGEGVQFQAMACKLGLADVKNLINLTFHFFVQGTSHPSKKHPQKGFFGRNII